MIQEDRGHGTSIFLTGPRGVGLSRMVDACALEGKLAGGVVLRMDASDAQDGDWGGVRPILEQLVMELPNKVADLLADHASVLAHIWPCASELTGISPRVFSEANKTRSAIMDQLYILIERISRRTGFILTANDIDQLDQPSLAFIALIAQQAQGQRLVVVTAASSDAIATGIPMLHLLRSEASSIILRPLTSAGTERLLISVFGEVPNVRLLADQLFHLSQGLPAICMQSTQYLLDKRVIHFDDGGWLLPTTVDRDAFASAASEGLAVTGVFVFDVETHRRPTDAILSQLSEA
jgi:hypothetical protein